jgi:hypothetical protein
VGQGIRQKGGHQLPNAADGKPASFTDSGLLGLDHRFFRTDKRPSRAERRNSAVSKGPRQCGLSQMEQSNDKERRPYDPSSDDDPEETCVVAVTVEVTVAVESVAVV